MSMPPLFSPNLPSQMTFVKPRKEVRQSQINEQGRQHIDNLRGQTHLDNDAHTN